MKHKSRIIVEKKLVKHKKNMQCDNTDLAKTNTILQYVNL